MLNLCPDRGVQNAMRPRNNPITTVCSYSYGGISVVEGEALTTLKYRLVFNTLVS